MLRKMCEIEWGPEFVKMMDMVNQGIPIGDYEETVTFLAMVEIVKKLYFTRGHFNPFKYVKRR